MTIQTIFRVGEVVSVVFTVTFLTVGMVDEMFYCLILVYLSGARAETNEIIEKLDKVTEINK